MAPCSPSRQLVSRVLFAYGSERYHLQVASQMIWEATLSTVRT